MWPWEHAAFGYLCYSLGRHLAVGQGPGDGATVALVAGTLVPDLVDKPLAWAFGVVPTGYAVAHSALVAVPALAALVALARRRGRGSVALAYAVGHLSHLAGDLLYPLVVEGYLPVRRLLWPVAGYPEPEGGAGFLALVSFYLRRYVRQLLALEPGPLLLFEAGLVGTVFGLWLYDGAPVLRVLWRRLRPAA